MKKQQNQAKFWAAIGLSGLIGLAIGLLLAPKSGKETRAQLKEKGNAVKALAQQGSLLKAPSFLSTPAKTTLSRTEGRDYDAIIIGAGHNGLVTAAYLAKAGLKVLVLERRSLVGGAAVTESFAEMPEFRFSAVADGIGHLSPQISHDLNLQQYGLSILPADPAVFAPQPDGTYLTLWRDLDRTVEEISRFSQKDAARYPAFVEMIRKTSGLVGGLMAMTPPHLPKPAGADLRELLKLLGPMRQLSKKDIHNTLRILPMSVADLLDEWFESDPLRGLIAARGVSGITWGPRAAGTVYTLLYAAAGSGGDIFGSSGVIKGGMGALTEAIARAGRAYGAEIRTGVDVAGIIVEEGQAKGVLLAGGEKISAAAVISNADPRATFLKLLGPYHLEPFFVRQVQHIKFRGSGARVHLALAELPQFTTLNGSSQHLQGYIRIAPSLDYLEKAFDAAKYGDYARQPYLEVTIPSLLDPGLAPAGQHVMSIYVQYAPYHLKSGNWEEKRQALAETVIDTLACYAPNLKKAILHSKVLTPLDLETIYGLPEGNPNHGEMTLDQFLHMRPIPGWAQYRTPVPGLYLCGAGTHPGGGVTGLPGKNAAREILKDWKG